MVSWARGLACRAFDLGRSSEWDCELKFQVISTQTTRAPSELLAFHSLGPYLGGHLGVPHASCSTGLPVVFETEWDQYLWCLDNITGSSFSTWNRWFCLYSCNSLFMRLTLIRMIPTELFFLSDKEHQEIMSGRKLKKYEKRFPSYLFCICSLPHTILVMYLPISPTKL